MSSNQKTNTNNVSNWLYKLGPVMALLVLVIVISIFNPSFLQVSNILNLLRQVSINALIAFGMTFVIITGGIDLSVGSVLALSSAFSAGFMVSGMNAILAVTLGLLMGAVFGLISGLLITKGKMAPFIATLATMTIYRGTTLVFTGGNPVTGLGDSYFFQLLGKGYVYGIPIPVIIMVIVFIILSIVLHKTSFGRKIYAVGGNERAANIAGINTDRVKMSVYAISGFLSSLAALILTSRLNSAQPTAGEAYEMDAIAAVVLGGTSMSGGRGTMWGTLVGALLIGTINNGLNLMGVSSFYQQIVKGIVIIVAVLLDRRRDD